MNVELTCPHCNYSRRVPKERIPSGATKVVCPLCKGKFVFSVIESEAESEFAGTLPARTGSPRRGPSLWEQRSEFGLWRAILGTASAVVFRPGKFFENLHLKGGLKEPLAFGLLVGSAGTMFGTFWEFLENPDRTSLFHPASFTGFLPEQFRFLLTLISIPFLVLTGIFFYGSIVHLLLLIVRGGKNGFKATFSVVAYAQAAQLWLLIPFFGAVIGGIWQMVVQIVGLRAVHEISYSRVLLAFLVPAALAIMILAASSLGFLYLVTHR